MRAAVIWAGLRAALFLLRAASGTHGGSSAADGASGPIAFVALVTVVCVLARIDARVTRELLFLRNLGLPQAWLLGVTAIAAGCLELMLRWIVS